MATKIGRLATLEISDDGLSYTTIGKVMSISEAFATDMADETNNDSGGWKEEQPADSQATFDVSGRYDPADVGQAALASASQTKAKKYYRFRPETGAGEPERTFQGYCPDFSVDTETGAIEEFSATVNSSGAVTYGVQS